ncbi:hypothetical protein [Nocardia puris]|uniref:PPE family protein n=1 Tax=Nocardia puris TaxID=208602 RepID=A0A366DFS3_9NOCA|nr:hypothetical protein [Nocardia puris]RBO88922.1 PPE family protein [Nocardia puris]
MADEGNGGSAGDRTDPWPTLSGYASEGTLEFEPSAAYNLANAAADAIAKLMAVREQALESHNHSLVFSNMRSGSELGRMFDNRGDDLIAAVDRHVEILEDMFDTFIAAGKAYVGADEGNAELLDSIALPTEPGRLSGEPRTIDTSNTTPRYTPDSVTPTSSYLPLDETDGPPTAPTLTGPSERMQEFDGGLPPGFGAVSYGPNVEEGSSRSYSQLYYLGQSVGEEKAKVANRAGVWSWLADNVHEAYSSFRVGMVGVTGESWRGAGREAAAAAVSSYLESVPPLRKSMKVIADNLEYAVGWMEDTRVSMPQSPVNPASQSPGYTAYGTSGSTAADDLAKYQTNMNVTYGTGATESGSRVPLIPLPDGYFGDVPSVNGEPGGESGGGPGPGGVAGPGPGAMAAGPGPGPGLSAPIAPGVGPMPSGGSGTTVPVVGGMPGGMPGREGAAEAARRLAEQQRQAAQQSGAQQAAQQALSGAQQAAQQALAAGQQALGQQAAAARPVDPRMAAGPGTGAKPTGGGGPGVGSGSGPARTAAEASRLFPRAGGLGSGAGTMFPRAGLSPTGGMMPGAPGAAGAPARSAGENAGERKRPAYLDSTEHLEEAMGEAPRVVRPVVER